MPATSSPHDPTQRFSLADFIQGASDVWRGWGVLMRNPRLWPWAIIPFMLNLLLFAAAFYFGYHYASDFIRQDFFVDAAWYFKALGVLIGLLLLVIGGAIVFFLFIPLASIIAEPFNDMLSEHVEVIVTGKTAADPFSLKTFIRSLTLGLWSTVRLAAKTTLMLLVILPVNFIPVIGSILFSVLSAAIAIRYLSLQYTSYCMDRRYWTYATRQVFLKRHRSRTIGFGAMAFATLAIPLVNLMFIPVSAIAGTLLFCAVEPDMPSMPSSVDASTH